MADQSQDLGGGTKRNPGSQEDASSFNIKRRGPGRPKVLTDSERKRKKSEKEKTRVMLGEAFVEWRELKSKLNKKADFELAQELMKSYNKRNGAASLQHTCATQSHSLYATSCTETDSEPEASRETFSPTSAFALKGMLATRGEGGDCPAADPPAVKVESTTTVDLQDQFFRWQHTCHSLGLTDEQMAKCLLDRYYEVDDPESECTSSQSNQKTLHLEQRLLTMWNNVKTANGISSDKEFLWFLLIMLEKYCQGMTHNMKSQAFTVPRLHHSGAVVTGPATSERCVPVKVDYVGPRHEESASRQYSNDAANSSLTLQPAVCQSNRAMVMLAAPSQQVTTKVEKTVQMTSSTSRNYLHAQGEETRNGLEAPQRKRCRKQVMAPALEEPVFSQGSETDSASEDGLQDYHGSLGSTSVASHLSYSTVNIDIKEEVDLEGKDDFKKMYSTVDIDIKEEVDLEGEDDFKEMEEDHWSSEDDMVHESDNLSEEECDSDESWTPPNMYRKVKKRKPRKKITKEEGANTEQICTPQKKIKKEEGANTEQICTPRKKIKKEKRRNTVRQYNGTEWVCTCDKKFATKFLLYKHKLKAHGRTCEYCQEHFPTTHSLNKHLKTHKPGGDNLDLQGNVMVLCDFCGQLFSKFKIKSHKLTHIEERPYKCEVENCTSAFKEKYGLYQHMRHVHSGPVTCPWEGCGKVLSNKSGLKNHLLVHTGERSHLCSYCGRTFQRGDQLKVHLRIHTGDQPFKCSLCNYSGRQSNSLRWHMKSQHPEHTNKDTESTKNVKTEVGFYGALEWEDPSVED